MVTGSDPGETHPIACANVDREHDRIQTLFMRYRQFEHNRQSAQKATLAVRNKNFMDVADEIDEVESDYENGSARGRMKCESLTSRHSICQRLKQQVVETLWPQQFTNGRLLRSPRQIAEPALFAIGDSGGLSRHGRGVMHVDASMPMMRAVVHNLNRRGYPIIAVRFGEAYSFQLCPKSSCLHGPVPAWSLVAQPAAPPAGYTRSR